MSLDHRRFADQFEVSSVSRRQRHPSAEECVQLHFTIVDTVQIAVRHVAQGDPVKMRTHETDRCRYSADDDDYQR